MPITTNAIIVIDTEITAWEGSLARDWSESWEHPEPIQLGAVRLNRDHHFSEESCLDLFIRPKANPILSPYIVDLTGISQEEVDSGIGFPEAIKKLHAFSEGGQLPIWSWGNDWSYLERAGQLYTEALPGFTGGFFDIREVFRNQGIDVRHFSSSSIHKAFDLSMEGRAHQALYDTRCIALALQHLSKSGKALPL